MWSRINRRQAGLIVILATLGAQAAGCPHEMNRARPGSGEPSGDAAGPEGDGPRGEKLLLGERPGAGDRSRAERRTWDLPHTDWSHGDQSHGDHPSGDALAAIGSYVFITAGTFTMGSPSTDTCRSTDESQHQVTLTHDFYMKQTEVTQDEFKLVMGYDRSNFGCTGCPVETVTWHEAAAYCNEVSKLFSLIACYSCTHPSTYSWICTPVSSFYACKGFRLPTEAEWEYSYRSGSTSDLYNGSLTSCTGSDGNAGAIGWYYANAKNKTMGVGLKNPNSAGLLDMAGNVREWVEDEYVAYGTAAVTDPLGYSTGNGDRVTRGGGWINDPKDLRAASRKSTIANSSSYTIGVRCARTK
jgi:formylglycine-generating enzyme required for sulfatase activity